MMGIKQYIKKACYPEFVESTFINQYTEITDDLSRSIIQGLKKIIIFLLRYYYPRLMGKFYSLLPFPFKNLRFLALNLDHFGPMKYLFYFVNGENYSTKKIYVVLQYTDDVNDFYVQSLPKNIKYIKNPYIWIIVSGFFFVKRLKYHIFPDFDQVFKKIVTYKKVDGLNLHLDPRYFTIKPTYNFSLLTTKRLNEIIQGRPYLIIFARTEGYKYSVGKSQRNLDINDFKLLVEQLNENGIMVVRFGAKYMPKINWSSSELFFDYTHYKWRSDELDAMIWSRALGAIGSGSGGIDVPCAYFGIPQLSITSFQYCSRFFCYHGLHWLEGKLPQNATWILPTYLNLSNVNLNPIKRLEFEYKKLQQYEGYEYKPFSAKEIAWAGMEFATKIGILNGPNEESKFNKFIFSSTKHKINNSYLNISLDQENGTVWLLKETI